MNVGDIVTDNGNEFEITHIETYDDGNLVVIYEPLTSN